MVMIRQQNHWDTNTKNSERSDYNEHVNTTCCFLVGWELQSAPKPDLIRPYFPPWCINSTLSELAGDVYIGQILKGTESPNIKMNPGILDWDAMLRSSQSRRSKFPGWNVQLPISKSRYTTPNADKNYSWLCVTKQCSFGCNWTFTSVSLGIILGNVSKYSNHFTFFWQLLCREDDFQRLFNNNTLPHNTDDMQYSDINLHACINSITYRQYYFTLHFSWWFSFNIVRFHGFCFIVWCQTTSSSWGWDRWICPEFASSNSDFESRSTVLFLVGGWKVSTSELSGTQSKSPQYKEILCSLLSKSPNLTTVQIAYMFWIPLANIWYCFSAQNLLRASCPLFRGTSTTTCVKCSVLDTWTVLPNTLVILAQIVTVVLWAKGAWSGI